MAARGSNDFLRRNQRLWQALGSNRGLVYWVLVGYWLVPIAFWVLWTSSLIVAVTHLIQRPNVHHSAEGRHPDYPWLRLGEPIANVRTEHYFTHMERLGGPPSRPIEDWYDAEKMAMAWMQYWGWTDATLTRPGADGGIDVVASTALAQVKFWEKPVPRRDLQNLVGAASLFDGERALLFFSKAGYTTEAFSWGERARIAMFVFDDSGVPQPQNQYAKATAIHR